MFGWLKRKAEVKLLTHILEDIQRFILSLQGMTSDEIGFLVGIATTHRFSLQEMLPDNLLREGVGGRQEDTVVPLMSAVKMIKELQQSNQQMGAAGMMVWLHTLRAIAYPEARLFGRSMWAELQRGFPHTEEKIRMAEEANIQLTGKGYDPAIYDDYDFIPPGLEPENY